MILDWTETQLLMELYLSIGSNLGEREKIIRSAIQSLEAYLQCIAVCSRIIEFPSWGFSGNDFLNCVVRFDLPYPTVGSEVFLNNLLGQIKIIEKKAGRCESVEFDAAGGRIYHDRPLDIDIIFYGQEIIRTEQLRVPHPLAGVRNFVLEPLYEVATDELKNSFPSYFADAASSH